MMPKLNLLPLATAATLTMAAIVSLARAASPGPAEVVKTYGDVALAMYQDSLTSAKALDTAVDAFLAKPDDATLKAARDAWKAARVPYMQTEGFRFGNAIVDDWEGRVNSWPLDEGLIDYVDAKSYGEQSDENPLYTANIIANPKLQLGSEEVDATKIDKALLKDKLQEAEGVEKNVATGYHAVEFLLWGQDLHGTGKGAGERQASDYDVTACTNGNCDRRRDYLKAATDLLVDDLAEMVGNWEDGGQARKDLEAKGSEGALATILTGIGSLSYGELAGERIKLGVLLHDPEEEHDCFSDNTHNSHYYDQVGMRAIWNASYTRTDGTKVGGPSIRALTEAADAAAAKRVDDAMADTSARMQVMKDTADSGEMAYDQMLAAGNDKGNKILLDVVDGLVAQTHAVESAVAALKLEIHVEGSDSLDNPSAVTSQ